MTQQPDNIDKQLENQLDQPINVLTLSDLEALIVKIVQKVLTEDRVLVTNNIRHYDRIPGLQLENWTAP